MGRGRGREGRRAESPVLGAGNAASESPFPGSTHSRYILANTDCVAAFPACLSPPPGGKQHKVMGERGHSQPLIPTWTLGTVPLELIHPRRSTEG